MSGGTAYTRDLKSLGGNSLRVQFPPHPPIKTIRRIKLKTREYFEAIDKLLDEFGVRKDDETRMKILWVVYRIYSERNYIKMAKDTVKVKVGFLNDQLEEDILAKEKKKCNE